MPRKINQSLVAGGLVEDATAAPKDATADQVQQEPQFDFEGTIREIIETNPAVSRNKKLKDSLKDEMLKGGKSLIETEFGVAKISESESQFIDEEGLLEVLKKSGCFDKYIKTRTIEYIDMEELESDIYNRAPGADTLESMVITHTSTSITKKLLVSAPKKKKGE